MTDTFEGNGDYAYTNDEDVDFKRKGDGDNTTSGNTENQQDSSHLNEKATEYIRECMAEKSRLEKKYPIAERLLDSGTKILICLAFKLPFKIAIENEI